MGIRFERLATPAHVALVTFDRPEKANAIDLETIRQLAAAWREIAEDDAIRSVVLTGAGDRVFSAGMDFLSTLAPARKLARGEEVPAEDFEALRDVSTAMLAGFDLRTPLVCAINGHCRAGGLDLMLASEIRYAVPDASFALEEVARGMFPSGNSTVLLARQIGWVNAHELLLTGLPIDAERALEVGLINRIVGRTELLDRTLEVAGQIAQNAPIAVRETRRGVRECIGLSLAEAYPVQASIGARVRATEDAREGARAFLEKRPPRWKGR